MRYPPALDDAQLDTLTAQLAAHAEYRQLADQITASFYGARANTDEEHAFRSECSARQHEIIAELNGVNTTGRYGLALGGKLVGIDYAPRFDSRAEAETLLREIAPNVKTAVVLDLAPTDALRRAA